MSRADLSSQSCSIARAVALVGDQWTIMILRELFLATRRFDDFQQLTGMSSHLLAQRLKKLESLEVVRREAYCQRPKRFEYRLTAKGRDLWPVIIAFKQWGDRWLSGDGDGGDGDGGGGSEGGGEGHGGEPAVRVVHKGCGGTGGPHLTCSDCGEPMQAHDAIAQLAPAFEQERTERRKRT